MKQPSRRARREYREDAYDIPSVVAIMGTRRTVKVRGIKPYTLERLTELWGERDMSVPKDGPDTLKGMCVDPYFSIKCACLIVLNSYFGIRFLYPLMWRVWAFVRNYGEDQVADIIAEGKKKLPLAAFWSNSAFSTDMRQDWMKMTAKEAETFQAEQISAAKLLSSKNTQGTEDQDGASSGGSETGGTAVY